MMVMFSCSENDISKKRPRLEREMAVDQPARDRDEEGALLDYIPLRNTEENDFLLKPDKVGRTYPYCHIHISFLYWHIEDTIHKF